MGHERPSAGPPARGFGRLDLLPILIFLVLTAIFFWRPLFAGQPLSAADILYQSPPWRDLRETAPILPGGQLWNQLMSDNVYGYYPEEVTATRFMLAGSLPLWDPYVFSGTPLLAESQRGIFYPLNVLVRLLPFPWAFSYGVIPHFFLAACFMYLLLRHAGLDRSSATLGGLVFEFSGWMVTWVLTPYGIYTVVWLPLMILFYDLAVRRRSRRWAIAAGLTIALQLVAGQIQFVSYSLIALGLLGLLRFAQALRPVAPEPRPGDRLAAIAAPVWTGAIALAAGFGLAMVQLLPTFEIIGLSGRGVRAFDDMLEYDLMPLSHLFTALVPYFYGSFLDGNYGGWLNMLETTFYFGVGPLLLAGIALWRDRRFHTAFFAAIGLLPFIVLLFPAVFTAFYYFVPGFKQTFPSRLLFLAPFGFAGLAAIGLQQLQWNIRSAAPWVRRATVGLIVLGFATGAIVLVTPYLTVLQPATVARFGWQLAIPYGAYQIAQVSWALAGLGLLTGAIFVFARRLVRPAIGSALISGVVVLDLFAFGINYNPAFPAAALYPVTPAIRFLQDQTEKGRFAAGDGVILPPNAGAVYGLEDVRGYTSLYSGRYQNVISATQGSLPVFPQLEDGRPNRNHLLSIGRSDSPLFQALNPRFLLERRADLPNRSVRNWASGIDAVTEIADVFRPRIRWVTDDAFERVLYGHPPTAFTYHLPRLPDAAQLQVGYGIDRPAWFERGDGVLFEVLAGRPGATPVSVLAHYVDPKNRDADRQWYRERVDLTAFAGGPVELTLRTTAGPYGDAWYDWALWSDPELLFGRAIAADLQAIRPAGPRRPAEIRRVTIDGVAKDAVWLEPGVRTVTRVTVPERGRLNLVVAALAADLNWAGGAADLGIAIDGAPVHREPLDPAGRADHRHWRPVSVDLSAFAGRTVDLAFEWSGPPGGVGVLGDPRVVDDRFDPGLDLVFDGEVAIYQNRRAADRAYLVAEMQPVGSPAEALAAVTDAGFDPKSRVVLENAAGAPAATGPAGSARIEAYRPNEVTVRTQSSGLNYLILADAFYPGWRAEIDGREAPLWIANYIVRAVAVPPGEHVVRFVYAPRGLAIGAGITLASAILCLVAALVRVRRKKVKVAPTADPASERAD